MKTHTRVSGEGGGGGMHASVCVCVIKGHTCVYFLCACVSGREEKDQNVKGRKNEYLCKQASFHHVKSHVSQLQLSHSLFQTIVLLAFTTTTN